MKKVFKLLLLLICVATSVPATTVLSRASSIALNKTNVILSPKQTCQLKIIGSKKKIKWITSKKKVASISDAGKITAKSTGSATITAKIGKKKYTCKVKVMTSTAILKKLTDAYNWHCEDIWNKGFCDIYHYIEDGSDSLGKKMNIEKTLTKLRSALKKKTAWNKFVTSVQGNKYKKYKATWKKLYKETVFLEKCLRAGT
ncbi:MAG TPA: hypothetical protein DF613_09890, partial [Lachnospiraceae bacterium]|nr:hypothetical protein [Lachnospiraceae bacterium]